MRIAIIGVGGIGGWLSARLLQAGAAEVVLIARGKRGAALKQHGLKLKVRDPQGGADKLLEFPPEAAEVHASVAEACSANTRPVDFCFLCVKTWQVTEAAADALPLLSEAGCVVTTQNGVLAPAHAATAVPFSRVLAGICRVVTFIGESDSEAIEMLPKPADIRIGEAYSADGQELVSADSERVRRITQVLSVCEGVTCSICAPSAWTELWTKAAASASFSIAALCRAPLDVLATQPETKVLLEGGIAEAVRCGKAAGHVSEEEDAIIERLVTYFSKSEPGTTPSTLRDVVVGSPSEMRELLGGIREAGTRLGVATPVHDFVYAALLPQELRARGTRPYTLLGVPGGAPHIEVGSRF